MDNIEAHITAIKKEHKQELLVAEHENRSFVRFLEGKFIKSINTLSLFEWYKFARKHATSEIMSLHDANKHQLHFHGTYVVDSKPRTGVEFILKILPDDVEHEWMYDGFAMGFKLNNGGVDVNYGDVLKVFDDNYIEFIEERKRRKRAGIVLNNVDITSIKAQFV